MVKKLGIVPLIRYTAGRHSRKLWVGPGSRGPIFVGVSLVALRFEAGKALFAGRFPELEDELAGIQAAAVTKARGGRPTGPTRWWAMTALSEKKSGVPRVRRL